MKCIIALLTSLLMLSACISINIAPYPANKDAKVAPAVTPAPTDATVTVQHYDSTPFIDPTDGNTYRWIKIRVYPPGTTTSIYSERYPTPMAPAQSSTTITPTVATQPVAMRWTPITGTFTDERDGHVYKTVTIGHQMWMAENLAYKLADCSKYYNDDPKNADQYGMLYNYTALAQACPKGWHIPSDAEWKQLEYNAGMSEQDTSKTGYRGNIAPWFFDGGATKMNIKFGGYYGRGAFWYLEQNAYFFTTSHDGVPMIVRSFSKGVNLISNTRLGIGYWLSIRCVKD